MKLANAVLGVVVVGALGAGGYYAMTMQKKQGGLPGQSVQQVDEGRASGSGARSTFSTRPAPRREFVPVLPSAENVVLPTEQSIRESIQARRVKMQADVVADTSLSEQAWEEVKKALSKVFKIKHGDITQLDDGMISISDIVIDSVKRPEKPDFKIASVTFKGIPKTSDAATRIDMIKISDFSVTDDTRKDLSGALHPPITFSIEEITLERPDLDRIAQRLDGNKDQSLLFEDFNPTSFSNIQVVEEGNYQLKAGSGIYSVDGQQVLVSDIFLRNSKGLNAMDISIAKTQLTGFSFDRNIMNSVQTGFLGALNKGDGRAVLSDIVVQVVGRSPIPIKNVEFQTTYQESTDLYGVSWKIDGVQYKITDMDNARQGMKLVKLGHSTLNISTGLSLVLDHKKNVMEVGQAFFKISPLAEFSLRATITDLPPQGLSQDKAQAAWMGVKFKDLEISYADQDFLKKYLDLVAERIGRDKHQIIDGNMRALAKMNILNDIMLNEIRKFMNNPKKLVLRINPKKDIPLMTVILGMSGNQKSLQQLNLSVENR